MSDPLRLGIDAANLVRDRRGMGRLARAVLREAERDPEIAVTLLAEKRSDRLRLRDEFAGTRVVVAPARVAQDRRRFDVVFYPFNGVRFRSAAPSLVLVHDVFAFTHAHPQRVARHREQSPIRRAAREASEILTTTEWNRAEIARELGVPPARIAVVPLQPDAFFTPGAAGPLPSGLVPRGFVLAVGGGEERKNLAMLLEAAAPALARRPETLVVVGTMPPALRERAGEIGLRLLCLAADDVALRDLYRAAALVLVPSRAEGFGLVAVEAMACGAAVLAADGSGLREATRGAALSLDAEAPAAWTAALCHLLDDEIARAALAARGAAVFARADRDAHARATLAALRRLARRERPD